MNRSIAGRLRTAVVVGAVVLGSALAGASAAQATPDVTDFEGTILRIDGTAVTGSNPVPAGRTLTRVRLATADPATAESDAFVLNAATPATRIKGTVIPGTPAEQVTFRINGTVVSTTVPEVRTSILQTDAGPLTATLFTAGGATYAIPQGGLGAGTRTVATSSVGAPGVGIAPLRQGLLPVGTQPQVGTGFSFDRFGANPVGSGGTRQYTVLDADSIRRNADGIAEELVAIGPPSATYDQLVGTLGEEARATVTLRNGQTVTVDGLLFRTVLAYGTVRSTWFFDRAALAAAGSSIADVTGVTSFSARDHALTWRDLGFDPA